MTENDVNPPINNDHMEKKKRIYRSPLVCIAYLEDNEIRIILKIPLINTREEYEVYKIYNLPLPVHRVLPNQTDILLEYCLETEMLISPKIKQNFHSCPKVLFKCATAITFSSVIQRQLSIGQK